MLAGLALAGLALAGCQAPTSFEEAQARCEKQGGMLAVIYTQKVSLSGIGPEIASPGDCLMPKQFEKQSEPAKPPPPANPPGP